MSAEVSPSAALAGFCPAVADWFGAALGPPTAAQSLAWPQVQAGHDTLVVAPTGSGKTLAAFLSALDALWRDPPSASGFAVLYVSPLKALNADVERNLRRPLDGVRAVDASLPEISVGVRSGDTPPAERQRMLRRPPQILITTPESLYLMATSALARPLFAHLRTVIVDEVHAVCGTKRGVHLAVTLERIDALRASGRRRAQRIGLSATVRPVEVAARFVAGADAVPVVVDAGIRRSLDVAVSGAAFAHPADPATGTGGVWDAVVGGLVADVRAHASTLIFVNDRSRAETLVARMNDAVAAEWDAGRPLAADVSFGSEPDLGPDAADVDPDDIAVSGDVGELAGADVEAGGALAVPGAGAVSEVDPGAEFARAHHGSVSPEVRAALEADLKAGRLPCLVATGTLELGIDMGAVDFVCQVASPHSVASALQRIGRSGHRVGATSRGRIYPLHRVDLAEAAAVVAGMGAGEIEATAMPRNCLDVLAQQLVAEVAACGAPQAPTADALYAMVRRAAPYATLPRRAFDATLAMVAGELLDPDLAAARPRVVWDRSTGEVRPRPGASQVAVQSGGTIPDRGLYPVVLSGADVRLGELDEEFVFESKPGDVFALGSSVWRIAEIRRDRVEVVAAPGAVPRMPFWRGEGLGRPWPLGVATGALVRRIAAGEVDAAALGADFGLEPTAAEALVQIVADQAGACGGVVPTEARIVVETFADDAGDWRIVLHSLFGSRTNLAWGLALAARVRERFGVSLEWTHTDDGIVFRFPELDAGPPSGLVRLVTAAQVRELVTAELAGSGLFAGRFREAAQRALLLPRGRPGTRTPLWLARLKAADLLQICGRDPGFPLVLETYRECLDDVFDLPALEGLLASIESGAVEVVEVVTPSASPFAAGMLWRFTFEYLYSGDVPRAEAKAAMLAVDRDVLAELLGGDRLRDLLEPEAVAEVTALVAGTAPGRRARDVDDVVALVRRVGDLTADELAARCEPEVGDPQALAAAGVAAGRICVVAAPGGVGGGRRWIVADDLDGPSGWTALGAAAPDAVARWLRRAVLAGGMTTADALAQRYGLELAQVTEVLAGLAADGVLARGEFAPGGSGEEWVGAEVLGRMHRRSLAIARHRTRPVDAAAYQRFLLVHQGVAAGSVGGDPGGGADGGAGGVGGVGGVGGDGGVGGAGVGGADAGGGASDGVWRPGGVGGLDAALALLEGAPLPAEAVETEILPARVGGYVPAMLDAALTSGAWTWRVLAGRKVVFARPAVAALIRGGDDGAAADAVTAFDPTSAEAAVLGLLARGGGWRTAELAEQLGMPSDPSGAVRAALDRLLLAGLVTNDSYAPVRQGVASRRTSAAASSPGSSSGSGSARRAPRRRGAPSRRPGAGRTGVGRAAEALTASAAATEGRWSLVRTAPAFDDPAAVVAAILLQRWGLVSKEMWAAEAWAVPWPQVRHALRHAEGVGEVRRGYFAEQMAGMQFADAWAVEALRRRAEQHTTRPVVLAAADPANAWGATFAAPGLRRSAGALVVLDDGVPVVAFEGSRVTPLTDRPPQACVPSLTALREALAVPLRAKRRPHVDAWGAGDTIETAAHRAFESAGWLRTPKGWRPSPH